MTKRDSLSTEPYKGVRDFYPEDQAVFRYLAQAQRRVAERFGYEEYHASILEPAELYRNKGADNEEIVNEQSYTFTDRGGREVTLRPEMTPTIARMVAARKRDLGYPLRLFSTPNLFRYERPQRGRLREHWQLNVDLFGSLSHGADAEVIMVAHALLREVGAKETDFVINLSSRTFLNGLVKRFSLSEDLGKALRSHLDRRAKMPESEFTAGLTALGIPLSALSGDEAPADVLAVLAELRERGVTNAVFSPEIVRGFDYYTGVVFEIFDTHPENNRAVLGGGRYDNLLSLFSTELVPAVGFGMGDVTFYDFLQVRGLIPPYRPATHLYVAVQSETHVAHAQKVADTLRLAGVNVAVDFGERKLADQLRQADKHRVHFALIIGDDEVAQGRYTLRELSHGTQSVVALEEIPTLVLKPIIPKERGTVL